MRSSRPSDRSAVVVGSGPNGLAAAITLAREGIDVVVLEAADTVGGGTRSAELTLPGFVHDVCSAVHPLAVASPFFRSLPLDRHGLEWVHPPIPLGHPFDDAPPALLHRSPAAAAASLGEDGEAYRGLVEPIVEAWEGLVPSILGPPRWPRRPLAFLRFALAAARSAEGLARARFDGCRARALFAGLAGHAMAPLDRSPTAGVGLVLGAAAHAVGWPIAKGGSRSVATSLTSHLVDLGGRVETGRRVETLADVPPARAVLLDVAPRALLRIAGERLPPWYRRRLAGYRHGPGVFKLDWALEGPVPWRDRECERAGTLHLGGSLEEIAAAEAAVWRGEHPERPFVLFAQPTVFDPTRAPAGRHVAWAYAHVPNGSPVDLAERIERQVERFAPGFGERVIARRATGPAELERYDPNYVGGDIACGALDLVQTFARPVLRWTPYAVPAEGLYLCSSATPPGPGVHGMCGHHAARAALARSFGVEPSADAGGSGGPS